MSGMGGAAGAGGSISGMQNQPYSMPPPPPQPQALSLPPLVVPGGRGGTMTAPNQQQQQQQGRASFTSYAAPAAGGGVGSSSSQQSQTIPIALPPGITTTAPGPYASAPSGTIPLAPAPSSGTTTTPTTTATTAQQQQLQQLQLQQQEQLRRQRQAMEQRQRYMQQMQQQVAAHQMKLAATAAQTSAAAATAAPASSSSAAAANGRPPSKSSAAGAGANGIGSHGGGHPHATVSAAEVQHLLAQCGWEDRAIHVARQILGGSSLNGFSRATAAAQRLKKQRARSSTKLAAEKSTREGMNEQDAEEEIKKETMNARFAKKLQVEFGNGIAFCDGLASSIRSILSEIDPHGGPAEVGSSAATNGAGSLGESGMQPLVGSYSNPPSGDGSSPATQATQHQHSPQHMSLSSSANGSVPPAPPTSISGRGIGGSTLVGSNPDAETVAEGNPNGSTLRKLRKRTNKAAVDALSQRYLSLVGTFDESGKRKLTKKEVSHRAFEMTRFRTLEAGDYVAAKVASHELWILARVVKRWAAIDVPYAELMSMTEVKRDALFKEKVYVQDHDDYDGDLSKARAVSRQYVLPLPKSYEEASVWGSRCSKGSRVYAMYPSTTALYSATVVDNTTYCRGQDDIIVVEFDGDEDDKTNSLPRRHIPARFVSLIPHEFPAAQMTRKKLASRRKSALQAGLVPPGPRRGTGPFSVPGASHIPSTKGRKASVSKSAGNKGATHNTQRKGTNNDDALNDMINDMSYGESGSADGLDSLDLDKVFDDSESTSETSFNTDNPKKATKKGAPRKRKSASGATGSKGKQPGPKTAASRKGKGVTGGSTKGRRGKKGDRGDDAWLPIVAGKNGGSTGQPVKKQKSI